MFIRHTLIPGLGNHSDFLIMRMLTVQARQRPVCVCALNPRSIISAGFFCLCFSPPQRCLEECGGWGSRSLLWRLLDIQKASQAKNSAQKPLVPRQLSRQGTLYLPESVGPQMFFNSCYLGACGKPCSRTLCRHVMISPCLLYAPLHFSVCCPTLTQV